MYFLFVFYFLISIYDRVAFLFFFFYMKVFIASDHAGFKLKELIKQVDFMKILGQKVDLIDLGTHSEESCDYPVYAKKLVKFLKEEVPFRRAAGQKDFGILICSSGFGMAMVANRYKRIRAVLCRSAKEASLSRDHNNANILCIGANFTSEEDAIEMIVTFLTTKFSGGRHSRRIKQF